MKNKDKKSAEGMDVARRRFLLGASVTAASLSMPRMLRGQTVTPAGPQGKATAEPYSPTHTMVYVNLRGGADGLAFLAPFGDADYAGYRPGLGVTTPNGMGGTTPGGIPLASWNLGSTYWHLSPALQPLTTAFANGDLALMPATGNKYNNRSHFVAMDRLELGTPPPSQMYNNPITDGFFARHFDGTNFGATPPLRGYVSRKLASTSFLGAEKSLAVPDPTSFDFPGDSVMRTGLEIMNNFQPRQVVKDANTNAFAAVDFLGSVNFSSGVNGYPSVAGQITPLGKKFREAEDLILSGMGPEAIEIDVSGWDTHQNQGPNAGGGMYELMAELAQAMGNFYSRLSTMIIPGTGQVAMKRTTLITVSEFGRTLRENGTNGTDHGNGGLVMAMGKRVNGRIYDDDYFARYQAELLSNPNITPLTASVDMEGDVDSLTDYRHVFAEAFKDLMGLGNVTKVYFPGYSLPTPALNVFG